MKVNISGNLNFMRAVRLVIGLVLMLQSFMVRDILIAVAGVLVTGMGVLNIGCCAAANCSLPKRMLKPIKKSVMMNWISNNKLYLLGALLGAIAGYLYWKFVGCSSGTCRISSRPFSSSLYGALMGSLIFGIFKKETNKTEI
jgi:hypothetical protein